jgi:hypothetical protein
MRVTAFGKFLLGFGVTLCFSLLWSVPLFLLGGSDATCRDQSINWLKNHLTYGITHHLFFPVAIGLLFATVQLKILRESGLIAKVSLAILLVLVTLVTIEDSTGANRRFQPYELTDACQWLCAEARLRAEAQPRLRAGAQSSMVAKVALTRISDCFSPRRHSAVHAGDAIDYFNFSRIRSTFSDIATNTNWIAKTAILLTWLLLLLGASLLWYVGAVAQAGQMDDETRFRLSAVLLFLAPWVPARVYVNWYQHAYLGLEAKQNTPLAAGIVILGIFAFLLYMAVRKSRATREAVLDILGVVVPICGFLLAKYTSFLGQINTALNDLSMLQIFTICFALGFLLVIAGRLTLLSEVAKAPNPGHQADG